MSQAPHCGPVLSQIAATGAPGTPGPTPTTLDKNLYVLADKIVDNAPTGLTITNTPKGYVEVHVGNKVFLCGDGVKTLDCYFSVDGGTTARAMAAIVGADQFIWNAVSAGQPLLTTDPVSFFYGV